MSERPGEGEADGVVAGDRGNWGGEEVVEGGGKGRYLKIFQVASSISILYSPYQ